MKVVLDSNILIAVLNQNDSDHAECVALIEKLNKEEWEVLAPVLYLWEQDAYLNHPVKSKAHVQNTAARFRVTTYDVTSGLYTRTYSTQPVSIKGADRVFVSLAKDHGVALVTNDGQVLKGAHLLGVKSMSVAEFLAGAS